MAGGTNSIWDILSRRCLWDIKVEKTVEKAAKYQQCAPAVLKHF